MAVPDDNPTQSLDSATVGVLAHGLLNSLAAVQMAAELLASTHQDRVMATDLGDSILTPQIRIMAETLELLARGLPRDVLSFLDER